MSTSIIKIDNVTLRMMPVSCLVSVIKLYNITNAFCFFLQYLQSSVQALSPTLWLWMGRLHCSVRLRATQPHRLAGIRMDSRWLRLYASVSWALALCTWSLPSLETQADTPARQPMWLEAAVWTWASPYWVSWKRDSVVRNSVVMKEYCRWMDGWNDWIKNKYVNVPFRHFQYFLYWNLIN